MNVLIASNNCGMFDDDKNVHYATEIEYLNRFYHDFIYRYIGEFSNTLKQFRAALSLIKIETTVANLRLFYVTNRFHMSSPVQNQYLRRIFPLFTDDTKENRYIFFCFHFGRV